MVSLACPVFPFEPFRIARDAATARGCSKRALHPQARQLADLAESELGILVAQCLDRRIPDKQTLIGEIAAWEHDRNAQRTRSDWRFTTKDARIKLKHLYPSI